jgi:hypothetical protein
MTSEAVNGLSGTTERFAWPQVDVVVENARGRTMSESAASDGSTLGD